MIRYEVIIYWNAADSSFIAEVPECMVGGATQSEAIENVHKITEEWIDVAKSLGRSIPEPKRRLLDRNKYF